MVHGNGLRKTHPSPQGIHRVIVVNPRPESRSAALIRRLAGGLSLAAAVLLSVPALALSQPDTAARQAYLVDLSSGAVLLDKNGTTRMAPSSMTQMMTAYMT